MQTHKLGQFTSQIQFRYRNLMQWEAKLNFEPKLLFLLRFKSCLTCYPNIAIYDALTLVLTTSSSLICVLGVEFLLFWTPGLCKGVLYNDHC